MQMMSLVLPVIFSYRLVPSDFATNWQFKKKTHVLATACLFDTPAEALQVNIQVHLAECQEHGKKEPTKYKQIIKKCVIFYPRRRALPTSSRRETRKKESGHTERWLLCPHTEHSKDSTAWKGGVSRQTRHTWQED